MDDRLSFIAAWLRGVDSIACLSQHFGVSRKTGHKWIKRYLEGGAGELVDQSRRPHSNPHAVPPTVEKLILDCRRQHPTWGPKKLRVAVTRDYPGLVLPSTSTISRMLSRHELAGPRRRTRHAKTEPYTLPFTGYDEPNAVWCADFKGHFALGSGDRCHPLTISDGFSRYLLRCKAMAHPSGPDTFAVFESAFREYGLPSAIRTDNGAPFASPAPGGLSKLSVWWLKLGIRPERIAVGHPEQNGRHERMHRTLKAEATKPPRRSIAQQQEDFDAFQTEYNEVRPHEALGQLTPASVYKPSARAYPEEIPDPAYTSDHITVRVNAAGALMWRGMRWYISLALARETIGIEPLDNGTWQVQFAGLVIGVLHRGADRIAIARDNLVPVMRPPTRAATTSEMNTDGHVDNKVEAFKPADAAPAERVGETARHRRHG